MNENPGMVHPERKFIVIYGLVKLENKLYTYKVHCLDGHRINISIPKR